MVFDPSFVDSNWNEAELSDYWMGQILKERGWGTDTTAQYRMRKEDKSGGPHRLDIALWIGIRTPACIELKSPRTTDFTDEKEFRVWLAQASKYAFSRWRYYHGAIVSPLGILTNGKHAVVFDGSREFRDVTNFYHKFDLSDKSALTEFLQIFEKGAFDAEGFSKNTIIRTPIEKTSKPNVVSADSKLADDLKSLYSKILALNAETKNRETVAFISTISLFMIAVLRDCGLYPNHRVRDLAERRSRETWQAMVDDLTKILRCDLTPLRTLHCEKSWELYKETSWFTSNLATFPAVGLGRAYEDLLHATSKNSTSYYTPDDLISEMLDEVKVHKSDTILDPTCGSGSFLATAVDRIAEENKLTKSEVAEFIENNIFGVDKDWFACVIARTALCAVYAKHIPYSHEAANEFISPKMNIEHKDFFDYQTNKRFSLIVGNPPWGSINNQDVLEPARKPLLKGFESYKANSDVCIYIVEKCHSLLSRDGRFGIVCKREVIEVSSCSKHREWQDGKVDKVWDFGRRHLFHGDPAQTAVIFGKSHYDGDIVTKLCFDSSAREIDYRGIKICSLFDCYKGYESGRDPVYERLALEFPTHSNVVDLVEDAALKPFEVAIDNQIFFLGPEKSFHKRQAEYVRTEKIILRQKASKSRGTTKSELKKRSLRYWLKKRAHSVRTGTTQDGWLWVYRNGQNAGSIIIPRFVRGSRIRAAIIETNCATMASLTVMAPKQGTKGNNKIYVAAFLNSLVGAQVAKSVLPIADAGKVKGFPEYVGNLSIPACPWPELKSAILQAAESATNASSHLKEKWLQIIDEYFELVLELHAISTSKERGLRAREICAEIKSKNTNKSAA